MQEIQIHVVKRYIIKSKEQIDHVIMEIDAQMQQRDVNNGIVV